MLTYPDDIFRTIRIDERWESYRDLLGEGVLQAIDDAASRFPFLGDAVFSFVMGWRSAAMTAAFPAIMAEHMAGFANAYIESQSPNANIVRLAESLVAGCVQQVPEITANPATIENLRRVFVERGARIAELGSLLSAASTGATWWEQYVTEKQFRIAIWSALRLSYAAIYNSYDAFVAEVTRYAANDHRIRTIGQGKGGFDEKFERVFGPEVLETCWRSKAIEDIRKVRVRLSHAGGRDMASGETMFCGVEVEGQMLQIQPHDVRRAYDALRGPVLVLLENAAGKR